MLYVGNKIRHGFIATQAGNIFERSQNLDLKRLLLKFVFESLTLTEGVLSYKLKFPFNEFVNSNILMAQAAKAYEPKQTLINQGLTENDNENTQFGSLKSYEPQILDKIDIPQFTGGYLLVILGGTRLATRLCCFGHSFSNFIYSLSLHKFNKKTSPLALKKCHLRAFFHARLDEFLLLYFF